MKKIMEMHGQGHPMRGFAVFAAVMMAVCGIAIAAGGGVEATGEEEVSGDYTLTYGIHDGVYVTGCSIPQPSTDVTIPEKTVIEGVEYAVKGIGFEAFKDCENLRNISLPDSVTSLDNYAFENSGLQVMTLGTGSQIVTVGYKAFKDTGSVQIKNANATLVTSSCAFESSGVTKIEPKVTFNENCEFIFCDCKSLTSVTLDSSIQTIPEGTFYGCSSLNIDLPSGLTSLGEGAFCGTAITTAKIPSGLTSISNYAFYGCKSLTTVIFHGGMTSIGVDAFMACEQLVRSQEGGTGITIPDSVTSIGTGAFGGCTSLPNVKLPAEITEIPENVFNGCTSMTSFDLDGITRIGDFAFKSTGLEAVNLPDTLQSIGMYAFQSTELGSLEISHNMQIGEGAFSNCGLSSITFSSQYTSTGSGPFNDVGFYDRMENGSATGQIGWNDYSDLKGYTFTRTSESSDTMVKTFAMTLDYPGEEPKTSYHFKGADLTAPADPEKEGRMFSYWAEGGTRFSFQDGMPGRDVVLDPVWKQIASFKDTDGTLLTKVDCDIDETIKLVEEDAGWAKSESVIVGWKTDSTGETVNGIGTGFTISSDVDFTAVRSERTDILVYIADGGTLTGSTYVPLQDGFARLDNAVVLEGKEFLGWCHGGDGGPEVCFANGIAISGEGPVYVRAYLVDDGTELCEVGFDYGGGSGSVDSQKLESNKRVALPSSGDAQRYGYNLIGWEADGSSYLDYYPVTGDVTLTAVWEPKQAVTYKNSDGTEIETVRAYTGQILELHNGDGVTGGGSALVGWKLDGSGDTVYGLGTDYKVESDAVFVAEWIDGTDALVYVADGGILNGDTYTPIEGGAAVLDATVEKEGCMFLGWLMTDSEGNTVAYANGMSIGASSAVRLTAYLVPEGTAVYEIRYDLGDGTGSITSQKAEAGQLIALPTSRDVHREGYALTGWGVSTATAGMTALLGAEPVALGAETITGPYYRVTSESVTISAIWESTAPAPTPEPVWWDDDDEPVVIPSGNTSSSSSERTDLTVVVAAAAAVAAAAIAALAIVGFKRE